MKASTRYAVALAAVVMATAWSGHAFAGNDNSNGGCQGNCPSAGGGDTTLTANPTSTASAQAVAGAVGIGVGIGGTGGAGGQGGQGGSASAGVVGSGNSSVRNENSNVGLNLQGQQQGQGQHQSNASTNTNANTATGGNSTAAGGAGGSSSAAGGNGAGNVTSIDVAAPVIPKPAAATAYAPEVPTIAKSCRLFFGGGGTTRDGSASGVIPLWKDQECVSVTAVQLMMEVNRGQRAQGQQAAFNVEDVLAMACKIEGMKETVAACASAK